MRKLIGSSVFAAVVYAGAVTASLADGGTFTRGCAGRDIQIMMMLETSAMSPQQMDDAMRTMLHARMMCFDGQVVDALALYDQVAQSVTPAWALSGSGRDPLH